MCDYLIKNGISGEKIIIENKSTTTEENNLNFLKKLNLNLIQQKITIVLVTLEVQMM